MYCEFSENNELGDANDEDSSPKCKWFLPFSSLQPPEKNDSQPEESKQGETMEMGARKTKKATGRSPVAIFLIQRRSS
jgi:hypothetical protein